MLIRDPKVGVSIDLNQPHPEVLINQEVVTVQLKNILALIGVKLVFDG